MKREHSAPGKVYLVGAGPGDPELLTLRGRQLLECADLVVYDALTSPALLRFVRPTAEKLFAGKRSGDPSVPQEAIERTLIAAARRGLTVVRLEGGDPFLFGRGGEEAEALAAAGVGFEIVPGISSAIGAPAYASIPLTHSQHASSVFIATGHEDPSQPTSRLRWDMLARAADTLVFMMPARQLGEILGRLQEHGLAPATPAALIEWGTWPRQRTISATVSTLEAEARRHEIGPPVLLLVGNVISVREHIAWFERRPLCGRRVLITRAGSQAGRFRKLLAERGAEVVEFPTLEIRPPPSWKPADRAIARLESYDWVVFTSANGVDAFLGRLWERGRDLRALGKSRLAAIGPATARRLEERGLRVDLQPSEYRAEGILEALHGRVRGARMLLARAREAREVLPRRLREQEGAHVDVVAVYESRAPRADASSLRQALERGEIDVVTFTSSSTVRNLARMLGVDDLSSTLARCTVACIGPITAATVRQYGLSPGIEPREYTIPALTAALIEHFRNCPSETPPRK